jgi:2-enoate reductase
MGKKYTNLFKPGQIGPLALKNRIVQSPLHSKNCEGFEPRYSHWYTEYFRERARGGVGFIITGQVKAERTIDPYPIKSTFPVMDSELAIRDFSEVTETVHSYGAKIAVQLSAGTGRLADQPLSSNWPAAPSRLPFFHPVNRELRTRELTKAEIGRLVESFGYAAGIAKRSGFDVLYIHAHSYLIDQFLSSCWNQRTDEYGGPLENRMRFFYECLASARAAAGSDFPIIVGLGLEHGFEGGRRIEETIEIAKRMKDAGVDGLHLREGSYDAMPQTMPNAYMEGGTSVRNAARVRQEVGLPVIVDGGLGDPEAAEEVLSQKKADFIGLARPLLADPEWPKKVKAGLIEDIRPCIRCMECLTRNMLGKFTGCTVNAAVGREREGPITRTPLARKVLVIGGGPGGMEAARTAALRGHDVTLLEKDDVLGGHLVEACVPSFKAILIEYRNWLKNQLRKKGVRIHTGREATSSTVAEMNPDVVIVSTGSTPLTPVAPGIEKAHVVQAVDVLRGKSKAGSRVVIVGGGLVGCETSLCLAGIAQSITVVEMLPDILMDVSVFSRFTIMGKMRQAGVRWMVSHKLTEVKEKGITLSDAAGREVELAADTVILAVGFKANDSLYFSLDRQGWEVYPIGDCQSPRKIIDAVRDGYLIAKDL